MRKWGEAFLSVFSFPPQQQQGLDLDADHAEGHARHGVRSRH